MTYQIGDIANGHQWNGVAWVPVTEAAPSQAVPAPTYEVGSVVNGHRWNGVAWTPVATTSDPVAVQLPLKRIGIGALAVVVLAVGGVVGFKVWDGMKFHVDTAHGRLGDPAGALAAVQKRWQDALPDGKFVTQAKDAGCFFELDAKGRYAGTVACGGARIVGSGSGQTWWEWSAPASTSSEPSIDAREAQPQHIQIARPKDKLVDGEGHGPAASLDTLPAPALAPAQPGLVISDFADDADRVADVSTIKPGDANDVYLPSGVFHIDRLAELPSISQSLDGGDDSSDDSGDDVSDDSGADAGDGSAFDWSYLDHVVGPAQGEQLTAVTWSFEPYDNGASDMPETTVVVKRGDTTLADFAELDGEEDSGTTLISAAPDTQLVFSTAGVNETVDVQTGKATLNAGSAAFKQPGWYKPLDMSVTAQSPTMSTKIEGEGVYQWQASREVDLDWSALTPYLPEDWGDAGHLGWASAGKAWLVLAVDADDSAVSDVGGTTSADISTEKVTDAWTLTIDGTATPVSVSAPTNGGTYYLAVEVPSTTRSVTAAVAGTEVFQVGSSWDGTAAKQSVAYPAQTYTPIDFGTAVADD